MLEPLTKKQKEIFDYLKSYIKKNGFSPSLEEIKDYLNLSAVSTVHEHIQNLRKKGYINQEMNQARGISIRTHTQVVGKAININITAQIKNKDLNILHANSDSIFINKDKIKGYGNLYGVIVKDDSMRKEGLKKNDLLIVADEKEIEDKRVYLCCSRSSSNLLIRKIRREKYNLKLESIAEEKTRTYKQVKIKGLVISMIRSF
jgi:repressor LexA